MLKALHRCRPSDPRRDRCGPTAPGLSRSACVTSARATSARATSACATKCLRHKCFIWPSDNRASLRRAAQSAPGMDDMSTKTHKGGNHHEVAAEHHENAAHHHREASKHYEAGDHEKAGHHAHVAHGHGLNATHHAH